METAKINTVQTRSVAQTVTGGKSLPAVPVPKQAGKQPPVQMMGGLNEPRDQALIKEVDLKSDGESNAGIESNHITGSDVVQRKNIKKGAYTLSVADGFEEEAALIWKYLEGKGKIEKFTGKDIQIYKTPGKAENVCHHWAFGGLSAGFSSDIVTIGLALGVYDEEKFEWTWGEVKNKNGLNGSAAADIKVYEDMAHSSRKKGDEWYHKFAGNDFIFAIAGGDDNLIYSSVAEINIQALPESGIGTFGSFRYVLSVED
jgi:hypothetical protein